MTDDRRIGLVDATNALAWILVLPHPDDPRKVTFEAHVTGLSKSTAAAIIRNVADRWEAAPDDH